ncbi:MAG: hypothetical protein IPO26_19810 [Saprospiraceae bacterium]|nr:hypothetical protein [Saprospiraceae bacterium]
MITFQFDAGNASADRNVACDFVRKLGGTGTDPCSGGFFIVNGVRFDSTSNSGGANGGNSPITLTFTATTLPLTCPTNFQIAEAIGCAYSPKCLDVYFEDSVTGQNCSSSNSFFRMTVNDKGNCGPYMLTSSGNSATGFPTSGVTTGSYTTPTIKAGNYILVFKDASNVEHIFVYNHVTQNGSCVTNSALRIDKTITSGSMYYNVGDIVNYQYAVTATGNITGPIVVLDDKISNVTYQSGNTNNDNILQTSETWIYTASYSITQADIDAGSVMNNAFARAGTIFSDTDMGSSHKRSLYGRSHKLPLQQLILHVLRQQYMLMIQQHFLRS